MPPSHSSVVRRSSDENVRLIWFASDDVRRVFAAALLSLALLCAPPAWAGSVDVVLRSISADGIGEPIGIVSASDSDQGLVIRPNLKGLPSGEYGFHLHSNGSCEPSLNSEGVRVAGLKAGGHWDPDATGTHAGPFGNGHRGDLSRLVVEADGSTSTDVVAPRLVVDDLSGRALVLHAGGDTYTDTPPLGGGGARAACGVAG